MILIAIIIVLIVGLLAYTSMCRFGRALFLRERLYSVFI